MKRHLPRLNCIVFILLVGLVLFGCESPTESVVDEALLDSKLEASPIDDAYAALKAEMEALEEELQAGLSAMAKQGNVVEVPAGSNDALAAAITQAGSGGTVLLRSGLHTESATVEITQRVKIVGEAGAVLEVNTGSWPDQRAYIEPALHVLNTPKVVIWGVAIHPPAAQVGGAAILVESSPHTVIGETSLYDHQFGIIVQGGDHTRIWENTVVTTPPSPQLDPFTPYGIVNVVGSHVQIARNDVSNAVTGIFVSDEKGLLTKNESHHNVIGMLLCNFTPFPGPGGTTIRAEFSATGWTVTHNNAHDNGFIGYFVFDGANNNLLANNAASNNAVFDMQLTAEQPRPGLPPAPATFENHVVAGRYQDITIQDCGVDNNIDGGNQIPCF